MSDILQLAGNVFSAFGQIKKGQAEKAAAYYNADVLNEEARQEGIKASLVADNIRRAKRLMSGKQTARYAKAGVKIGTGTTLEVLADTAAQYDRDLAINDYNKKVKQAGLRTSAKYSKEQGQIAMQSAYISAGGTLLSSASDFYHPKSVKNESSSSEPKTTSHGKGF